MRSSSFSYVSLIHLLHDGQKLIGLQFYPRPEINEIVKNLPGCHWSKEYNLYVIPNKKENITAIFQAFMGKAWVDGRKFFSKRSNISENETPDVEPFKARKVCEDYRRCPPEYLDKLAFRKYSINTVRTYVAHFEGFINYYKDIEHRSVKLSIL